MLTLPEPVSETARWLLVFGLAFFMADTAVAGLEQRWSDISLTALAEAPLPIVKDGGPAPIPPELVRLLSTTQPIAVATESVAAATEGPKAIPETSLPVTLMGTMAGVNGSGVAVITLAGDDVVVESGQPLADWTLVAVHPTDVVLERAGASLVLELDQPTQLLSKIAPAEAAQVTGSAPPALAVGGSQVAVAPATPATPAAPVEPLTQKSELESLLSGERMGEFSKQGSLKPILREGEIAGYQIRIKDPAFPLARLGLQNGDIVKGLNGVAATGPESMSTYMRTLKNSSTLTFDLERNGETIAHRVDLE